MATERTNAFKNPCYRSSSLIILLFFTGWGIWWSFFQIWLTGTLHFSGAEVGTIYSFNSAATLVVMFLYGAIQDHLGIRRTLLIVCAALQMLLGPFFTWIYAPLLHGSFYAGTVIGAVYLSFAFLAASPTFEAVTERFSRRFGFEYGQARAWGSFGYALSALAAGLLFVVSPYLVFWASSAIATVLLVVMICDGASSRASCARISDGRESEQNRTTPSLREILSVFKLRALWQIIAYIILSWTFYTVFDQQMFPDFYTKFFNGSTGQAMYGALNSLEVLLEALMMACVPWLMRRAGVRRTLLLGVVIMIVRIGGCGLVTNPVGVSLIKLLHAPETALFVVGLFRYFTLHFDTKVSATLYMVGFQIAAQIGQIIFSTPLGAVRDGIGYSSTFLLIAGIVAVAGIYALFILKRDDQDVEGQPLSTK
ncbi:oligosaccharide/H+ symporter, major facilitator superfamily (MFS) [Coriobacterium glomerans PW2]|uniref:Oligosaccharide/H+ symporter, major facilitator superfamily (MFS) n=1 Tax=Coriobacterium glomerans (strain ATCC 49209 / DSM 20642 / JCM 10262 / PW2) TaxID=700015 RepID=F2NBG7_CORGP|nr:oligosaccharide MFS transporter [Coriobacterium glomerans]AEB06703.1 oligosaccharide/H+ symporter, major facilitator superfamily (MFS) [Coriobacterium glomerans PW2]